MFEHVEGGICYLRGGSLYQADDNKPNNLWMWRWRLVKGSMKSAFVLTYLSCLLVLEGASSAKGEEAKLLMSRVRTRNAEGCLAYWQPSISAWIPIIRSVFLFSRSYRALYIQYQTEESQNFRTRRRNRTTHGSEAQNQTKQKQDESNKLQAMLTTNTSLNAPTHSQPPSLATSQISPNSMGIPHFIISMHHQYCNPR